MIQVTERATRELKDMLGESGQGLRLLVSKGGCAGHQYGMKLDQPKDDDTVVETSGGRIYIDPDSLTFLQDSVVDYSDSLQDTGFKIVNPNAARSCGCGSSFEPAKAGDDSSLDGSVRGQTD